jgi:hypothetical protein
MEGRRADGRTKCAAATCPQREEPKWQCTARTRLFDNPRSAIRIEAGASIHYAAAPFGPARNAYCRAFQGRCCRQGKGRAWRPEPQPPLPRRLRPRGFFRAFPPPDKTTRITLIGLIFTPFPTFNLHPQPASLPSAPPHKIAWITLVGLILVEPVGRGAGGGPGKRRERFDTSICIPYPASSPCVPPPKITWITLIGLIFTPSLTFNPHPLPRIPAIRATPQNHSDYLDRFDFHPVSHLQPAPAALHPCRPRHSKKSL